jgi:heat-inducible transcriptional repressor
MIVLMKPLSPRQISIIKAIVEEYTSTGEAVGSDTLDKKFNLGVSPATIRNEMVRLEDLGYLKQPHTSAGRVPTPIALKLYVSELMREQELSVTEEVAVKERMWDQRAKIEKLLQETTKVLSEKTGTIGFVTTSDGMVYSSGYANLLNLPEFFDIDVTRQVLSTIESYAMMESIFARSTGSQPFHIVLGDEFGNEYLYPCAMAYTDFGTGALRGRLGVIGPARLNYPYVMPMLRHMSGLLNEISTSW